MPLFTLIFEYGGGTYISQMRSRDERSAQVDWAKSLKPGQIHRLGRKRLADFAQEIEQDSFDIYHTVALDGLNNAWYGGTPYGLLNIVKTESTK